MKSRSLFFILCVISICFSSNAQDGEALFKTNCSACHKYTTARMVGPGLANVHLRVSEEWFLTYVKSSQTLIKSGDERAVAIFEEYNQLLMPDQNLSQDELKAVWDFIISKSPAVGEGEAAALPEEEVLPFEPTAEDILRGEHLFVGLENFKNKGATCNSCHHVKKDNLMAGGSLAVELSDAYSRLGNEGIQGIITGLPFPAMKDTYGKHQVTEEEAYVLAAFLKDVDEQRYYQHVTNYGNVLLTWGIVGAIVLMGLIPAIWFRRKKNTVNLRIYERQIQSIN